MNPLLPGPAIVSILKDLNPRIRIFHARRTYRAARWVLLLLTTILLPSCNHPSAQSAFDDGTAHWERGELDAAVAAFTTAMAHDPKDATAVLARGLVYYDQANLEQAIADYSTAIGLDPTNCEALRSRGRTYAEKNLLDKAVADLDAAIRLDSGDIEALLVRGLVHYNQEHLGEAIKDYRAVIAADPDNLDALRDRGRACSENGDLAQALADLNAVLRWPPRTSEHYSRAAGSIAARTTWRRGLPITLPSSRSIRTMARRSAAGGAHISRRMNRKRPWPTSTRRFA